MAIENPRLAIGPTYKRDDLSTTVIDVHPIVPAPGATYERLEVPNDLTSNVLTIDTSPQILGQIAAHKVDGKAVQMYVVVDISGTLTWKRVEPIIGHLNTTTGREWDTLQYDILG